MARQRFREDTAGTLEFYNPLLEVPTSATVTLYKPSGEELQAAAAATVDSVDTTVSGAVSRGATSFAVASAASMAEGRRYLVESGGDRWPIQVQRLASTTVYPLGKVPFAIADGSTFKGWRLSYSLTTTHTADKDRSYRALWTVVIAGATHYWDDLFDVVAAVDYYPTALDDLTRRYRWIGDRLPAHDEDGEELLETAWNGVKALLWGKELDPSRVKDKAALVDLHVEVARRNLLRQIADVDNDKASALERAEEDLLAQMSLTLASRLTWYDEDEDLAASSGEEFANRRGIRVTR